MSLATYEEARPWAKAIRDEVLARRMPKWHAARGYGDFVNDPSLSPFEVALVVAWADGGAPRRLPANAPAPPKAPAPAALPEPPGSRAEGTPRVLSCGVQALTGRLTAVRPALERGASVLIEAGTPDGRREIVAWIRDYDPAFPTTYALRNPIDLPAGSTLRSESRARDCTVTVSLTSPPAPR